MHMFSQCYTSSMYVTLLTNLRINQGVVYSPASNTIMTVLTVAHSITLQLTFKLCAHIVRELCTQIHISCIQVTP